MATTTSTTQRREDILEAARAVLGEHGYERTTVSAIAQRASVAQGTFYLYFPSKEALPGALASRLAQDMGAAARAVVDEGQGMSDTVDALVGATLDVAASYHDVLLIANRGFELCEDFSSFRSLAAPWLEGLEALLRHFDDRGEIDGEIEIGVTAIVLRDVLDRSAKAHVLFQESSYAEATALLVRRALSC